MNSAFVVALPVLAFCGALMYLLPHITPRRYYFAITVPPDFPSSEPGRTVLRRYHLQLAVLVLLVAALLYAVAASPDLAMLLATAAPMVGGMAVFLLARNRVRQFSISGSEVREAELSTEPDRLPRWIALALPPFAAPAAAAAYLRAHWDEIPARFPVHWDLAGEPNGWAEKTTRGVYGPLIIAAGIMLLILLLCIGMFYGARRGRQRLVVVKMIIAAIWLLAWVFTAVSLMPVLHIPIWLYFVPTGLFTILILAWCFKVARDPSMPVDRTPDQYWYLGNIYYNPGDPAVFVQKRIGFGYTFNFGNPAAWIGLGVFLVAMLALILVAR